MAPEGNKGTEDYGQMQSENPESQVITYTAPWNMFAMGFSNKTAYPFRLAIASFLPEIENSVLVCYYAGGNYPDQRSETTGKKSYFLS